jgi:phospholipase C
VIGRRAGRLVAAMAVGIAPLGTSLPNAFAADSYAPITHVIVVMQSGHSFDNYFGTRRGVNGIQQSADCQPLAPGVGKCAQPNHINSTIPLSGLSDSPSVIKRSINNGLMNGFYEAQHNASDGALSMGYLDGSDLPYYWSLADRFTLFDNFFAASQAGPLTNRVIAMSGTSDNVTSDSVPTAGITGTTVFSQLEAKGLSWKYYVQNYAGKPATAKPSQQADAPVLDVPAITGSTSQASHIVGVSQYFTDLTHGTLPNVSYISATVDSEQAPQNPATGEAFVQSLINALMQSHEWSHTALLLTYDDSGGWYDNVKPPVVNGQQIGLRVPAILVSPYARAGYVDKSFADTATIPALIDQVFRLPDLAPASSPANAIKSGLNFGQHPISPFIGPSPGSPAALVRPAVGTIYVLYIGALLAAGILIVLAFRQYRRRAVDGDAAPPTEGESS